MKREPNVNKQTLASVLGLSESTIDTATARGAPGGPDYQVGEFFAWLLLNGNGIDHAQVT